MSEIKEKPALSLAMDSIGPAIDWTKELLFSPFDKKKWAWLALMTFIIAIASGGGGGNFGNWGGEQLKNSNGVDWIKDNVGLFILLVIFSLLFVLIVRLIFMYFASCFQFVFLDNLIKNSTSIKESFANMKGKGLSFFLFQITIGLIVIVFSTLVLGIPVLMLLSDSTRAAGVVLIIFALILLLLGIIPVLLIMMFTKDFVFPIMYKNNILLKEGWGKLKTLINENKMHFLVYTGIRILIHIGMGIIGIFIFLAALLVSAIVLLPVGGIIGLIIYAVGWSWLWLIFIVPLGIIALLCFAYLLQYAMLPVSVFSRYYPLVFLNNIAPDFELAPDFETVITE